MALVGFVLNFLAQSGDEIGRVLINGLKARAQALTPGLCGKGLAAPDVAMTLFGRGLGLENQVRAALHDFSSKSQRMGVPKGMNLLVRQPIILAKPLGGMGPALGRTTARSSRPNTLPAGRSLAA